MKVSIYLSIPATVLDRDCLPDGAGVCQWNHPSSGMWNLVFSVSGSPKALMTKFVDSFKGLYSSTRHTGGKKMS